MNELSEFLMTVDTTIESFNASDLFFRGHGSCDWTLIPGLGRKHHGISQKKRMLLEQRLFYKFKAHSASTSQGFSSWDIIFSMQHHGLPTRLLDWSETFSTSLYFAIKDFKEINKRKRKGIKSPCIWVCNPYALNKCTADSETLYCPSEEDDTSYYEMFIGDKEPFFKEVVALFPRKLNARLLAQRGAFTLHSNLKKPLDQLFPECVKKVDIPIEIIPKLEKFLTLAGATSYQLFPDLDGLARHLWATEM